MKRKILTLNHIKIIFLIFISLFFNSCASKQDIVYFQDIDAIGSSKSIKNFSLTIFPDDMLTISVSALDQDAARPFNLPMAAFSSDGGEVGRATQQTYLVDSEGNIDFPVLGKLKIAGLSRIQATDLIKDLLKQYIKNPIINIRITNFTITVLGEVGSPGSYTIPNERITIIEALGRAGDLTIQARRNNVLVIRENNGKKTYNRINLTSEEVFNSPVYYLTQNDVIYVEPNNARKQASSIGPGLGATLSIISTIVTVTALVVSLTR